MISISLIRRGFHSSRVSFKRSSWFRRRGRIKSNGGAVVEKVDEPTEESDETFGSLGLDEDLLRDGSVSEIKVHLHNLQHEFPDGYEHLNPVNNKKYETNIEKERDERTLSKSLDRKRRSASMVEGREALNMYHHSTSMLPRGLLKKLKISDKKRASKNDEGSEGGFRRDFSEAETLRRTQKRREFRVLDILRSAIEDGHVRHPALRPRGVPIELLSAKTTKCMTKYVIEWTLPSEVEDHSLTSSWASCDAYVSSDYKTIRTQASRALEKSAGRLRVFMQQSARLRKAPRLEFRYTTVHEDEIDDDDVDEYRDGTMGPSSGDKRIDDLIMQIQKEIERNGTDEDQ